MNAKIHLTALLRITLCVCLLALSSLAQAQWIWLDSQGKHVFSDMAPPTSIPEKSILKRPADLSAPSTPAPAPTPAAAAGGIPSELGKKVSEQKAAEDAKAQQLKDQEAQVMAENCNRARRSKAGLETGQPLRVTNEQGEQTIMSDQNRTTELQRINDFLSTNCN